MTRNELTIMNYFMGKGLSRAAAAGIVGNLQQESGLDPNAPGGGLAQGQGGRTSSGSLQEQLNGIWRELSGPYVSTLHALQGTSDPRRAAIIFERGFERPERGSEGKREAYAQQAYSGQESGLLGPLTQGSNPIQEGGELVSEGIGAAGGVLHAGESAGQLAYALLQPATWLRIAEGLGGIVLIYMGLSALTRSGKAPELIQTTKQAASTPRKVAEAAVAAAAVK